MSLWTKDGYFPNIEKETLGDGRTVFVARHPFVPGVTVQATTEEEAATEWHEAREEVFEDLAAMGAPIPPPFYFQIRAKLTPIKVTLSAKLDLAPAVSRSGSASFEQVHCQS